MAFANAEGKAYGEESQVGYEWRSDLAEGASHKRWSSGVLLLAALIYWGTRPWADALLEITSPTPAQIHQIAWTLLRHDDFKIRARATEKLRSLGQTAVPVLKDVAQTHPDAAVRKAVLDILLGLDPKAAADLVAQLSQDKNPDVQRTAISAAKHLDDPRSYEILDQGAGRRTQPPAKPPSKPWGPDVIREPSRFSRPHCATPTPL